MARDHSILLGDIGSTNARFALLTGGRLDPVSTLPVADFPGIEPAIRHFLADRPATQPIGMLLAVAGPVSDGITVLTNSGWTIDPAALAQRFGVSDVRLVNDFAAIAMALPHLRDADLLPIGPRQSAPGVKLALGPGTGLGIACLVPDRSGGHVLSSEGGHSTLAGGDAAEDAVLARIREQTGHVSAERVLSGPGLSRLCATIAGLAGETADHRSPASVVAAARDGSCRHCARAVDMFCGLLGSFAGNAALMFNATGGVYLAGGIVPRMTDLLERSAFRERFTAKGRFNAYLDAIPTFVIQRPDPAFLGLQAAQMPDPDRPA